MLKSALRDVRKAAYRWLAIQSVIVIMMSLLLFFFQGINSAKSALIGGIVCILPNLIFARRLFLYLQSFEPKRLIKTFYIGEIIKLTLTGVLFVLVFRLLNLNLFGFFVGFLGAQWAFWLAPILELKVKNKTL